MSEQARRKILERRAAFIAAAIASFGTGATGCDSQPRVCLSAVPEEKTKKAPPVSPTGDAAPSVTAIGPAVCLSEAPQPCLAPPPPDAGPKPVPCLSIKRPLRDAGAMPCLEAMPEPIPGED